MRRKTFDTLLSVAGMLMAAVLLVAGGLLLWASMFVSGQVHDQLAEQQIFFPPANSAAVQGDQFAEMRQYGGEQLLTGNQAETYANDFIAVHLSAVADGKTYAQVSSALQADPTNVTLKAQADTLFKGSTLRGLLLNAYAFGVMGSLAMIGAIVAFVAAGLLLVFSLLGFRHSKTMDENGQNPGSPRPGPITL
ncbi:MAG: hypothetical protein Q7L55_07745 [Actinomycetota bacterium]|nr:hypothetical protein [Actinomycetota bacterium]